MKLLHAILILSLLQLTTLSFAQSLHLSEDSHTHNEHFHIHHADVSDHTDTEDAHDETSHTHTQVFELTHPSAMHSIYTKEHWKAFNHYAVLNMSYKPNLPPPNYLV